MAGKDACKRIRRIRQSLGLTQQAFAEQTGLSVDAVGKIERGVNIPTLDTVFAIAAALGIPVAKIINSEEKSHGEMSDALADLNYYLSTRTDEDIKAMHRVALALFEHKKS